MTKQNTVEPFTPILRIIQFINYLAVVVGLLAAMTYLFSSPEGAASFNGDIEPKNQYIVGGLYLVYVVLAAIAAYTIRMRKSYAPYVFVLAMYAAEPLMRLTEYYENFSYEGDVVMIVGLFISYVITILAMAYMLFNKRVRKIFTE